MGVRLVCECICVMKGIKPKRKVDADGRPYEDYWAASIVMLSDMKFLDSLKEYDKDNIPWLKNYMFIYFRFAFFGGAVSFHQKWKTLHTFS